MKILVINKQSLEVLGSYQDVQPSQAKFGGAWGRPEETIHLGCPSDIDPAYAAIEDDNGTLSVIVDDDKHAVWEELQWSNVRRMRDVKLADCDWTQLVDSPLNSQDKASWAAYRQELRDLPENTEDPTAPVWPEKPNQEI